MQQEEEKLQITATLGLSEYIDPRYIYIYIYMSISTWANDATNKQEKQR